MPRDGIERIGFIGLGNMGGPMARNLGKAGYRVLVHARNKDRLVPQIEAGATVCETIRDVAAQSDVVFTCLTDTAAVEQVVFGEGGIVAGARADTILVDTSTISPKATIRMGEALEARCGMHWVDAPISGGSVGAEAATLSIFVGGDAGVVGRLDDVFAAIGRNITRMGELGAGQTTKLINQIFVSCSVMMIAEAVGLAVRAGLDVEAIPAALAGGRGDSVALQNYWPRLAARDYTALSTITSILKDIDLLEETARGVGAPLPMTATAREYYQAIGSAGFAAEDLTAVARLLGHPAQMAR